MTTQTPSAAGPPACAPESKVGPASATSWNGPDLYAVVLVDGDRVELGELKGNQGAQNYELPGDIDPATVETVEVWCKRFDSTFVSAPVG